MCSDDEIPVVDVGCVDEPYVRIHTNPRLNRRSIHRRQWALNGRLTLVTNQSFSPKGRTQRLTAALGSVVVLYALMTNCQHPDFPPWQDFVEGHIACGTKACDQLSARCTRGISRFPIAAKELSFGITAMAVAGAWATAGRAAAHSR